VVSEPAGAAEKPKKGPGRPKSPATATSGATPRSTAPPPLEKQAQRNTFSTLKLVGRFIGSTEHLAEEDFEDIGRGIADLARLFPAAETGIRQAVTALGPTATALDLFDKLGRLFTKSKLKVQVDARLEAAKHGADKPAGV
jgi:hypothetical protein